MGIVVAGMGTHHFFGATGPELSITGDVVVVADASREAGFMTLLEHFIGETLIAARCGAVDDDEVDFTHDCTNKVELIAVKMAMMIWINCFQKPFFIMD